MFFNEPTIGNKTGECLLQKTGFPFQMNSFPANFTETNSAPFELISIFKPKLIICEGAYVYNTLLEMYPTASLDYSEKGCVVVDDKNYDFKLIGYSRFRSNIRNKKGLAELLKRYI